MTDMALIPYGDYQAAANQVRTLRSFRRSGDVVAYIEKELA